jgi:predicted HicB family RNase H-like nuclease
MTKEKPQTKKIHVDLPEEVHQRVRVKAALEDVSMQTLVARIVTEAVSDVVLPRIKESKRRG